MKRFFVLEFAIFCLPVALFAQTSQTGSDYVAKRIQLTLSNAPQPVPNASVFVSGNPGPATYFYWIVTQTSVGASSPAGPFQVINAPNTLSGSNFNQISWTIVPGATYDVLRTSNTGPPFGACNCAVATGVSGNLVNDQSNALSSYTLNTLDPSTKLVVLQNVNGALAPGTPQNLPGLTVGPGATSLQAVSNTSESTPQFNRVVWLDGVVNTTLATCLSVACSAKSVCEVPPNYSENVAGDITVTNDCGLHFDGVAAINLGSHQFKCAGGTCNDFFIDSDIPFGSSGTPSAGVVFTYTGTTTPFSFGDSTATTSSITLRNFAANVSSGGGAVSAITLNRINVFTISNVRLIGGPGQIGINMVGTGGYTGNGEISNVHTNGFSTCIKMTTEGNYNRIFATCANAAAGGKTIDIADGSGNIIAVDAENGTTGVNFGNSNNVFGNRVQIYGQGNTTDAVFGAASVANTIDNIGANCSNIVPTVSDSGTNNSFWNPCKFKMDVNGNFTIASLKFAGTVPTCTFTSGGGTSPNCTVNTGSTNNTGSFALLVGSGSPAASGTFTLTFAGTFGTNLPNCSYFISNRAGSNWNARASLIESSVSTSTNVVNWDNNAVALTPSGNYQIHYNCNAD